MSTRERKPLRSTLARLSKKDREFMETARDRFKQGQEADENQRAREIEAISFAAGDQWPADIATIRAGNDGSNGQPKAPARPMLTVNQTLEPLNQLLAQMSGADLGFELVSADDFSDLIGEVDETEIKTREGLARRIQRDSQAIEARLWGADRGNICGRGYWMVLTRFVDPTGNGGAKPNAAWFDQEIYIGKIYNQNSVTLDPNREHFDGSDADWGFVGHDMPSDEYEAEHGEVNGKKNPIVDASDDEFRRLGEDYPTWFTTDEKTKTRSYRVVDYYYVVREPRQLVMLADQSVLWADDAPDDATVIDSRDVVTRKVKWAKIDGYQILEETDFPSPYIPIVEYIARPLQPYDGERRDEGIVQPMMDSGRGFNYMLSRWVEAIGLSPLRSIMMAEGQDEGYEAEWESINTRTGIAHFKQTDLVGRPAGEPKVPPTGNDVVGPISGAIQVFRDSIHATTQSHAPSQGEADPALRSAKAISAVVANDQRGDSSIIGNWARSIRHEGRIINSLLYPIYGIRPGRLASLIDADGKPQPPVMLNKPFEMQGAGKTARPVASNGPAAQHFKLTKDANFNVVVKVTKNYETLRQEQAESLGQIISSDPGAMMSVFGDLFFKMQDGPGHDEMAERMKAMLNPKILQQIAAKAQGSNIPPEAQAMIQQLQEQLQQAQGVIKSAQTVIQTDQVKHQAELQKTKMVVDKDILLHQMDNATKIEVARISASKQAADPGAESQEELLATGLEQQREAQMSAQEHAQTMQQQAAGAQQDAALSAQEHGQAMQQGDQAHAQALQQADRSHGQALQQGQQAVQGQMATAQQQADLQPPPEGE